jgi:exopolysaccharide production protein ExoQ
LWLGILLLGAMVALLRPNMSWLVLRFANPFLLLFVVFAVASVLWSIDSSVSARRLVRMFTIVLACLAFVSAAWHPQRFQNVLRPIVTIMLVASIAFGVLSPSLAIHSETSAELLGAWHGLANHKNGLGALACIGLIIWFHGGLTHEVKMPFVVIGCVVSAVCLVLSRSSTSLLTSLVVMTFLFLFMRAPPGLRPYQGLFVMLLVGLLLVYALALLNIIPGTRVLLAPISAITDKDATLTGRTEIWSILEEHIRRHPLLGTGYAAYWLPDPDPDMDSYEFITKMGGFYPGSAHNGFLDVTNDLGWLGLACLIAYIITYVRQSLSLLPIERSQAALYIALFLQQVISNQSESHWFSVLSVDFVIMTLATLALARSLLENRLREVFGDPFVGGYPQSHGVLIEQRGGGRP